MTLDDCTGDGFCLATVHRPGCYRWTPPNPAQIDGTTYDPVWDEERLSTQLGRVYVCLRDGEWWTLRQLATAVGGSEAGVSARLRDLRKPKNGALTVERRRVNDAPGLWEYRLAPTESAPHPRYNAPSAHPQGYTP